MRASIPACLAACLGLAMIPRSAEAHEFWIEPRAHVVAPGDTVSARLFVGQDYEGSEIPFVPSYFESFDVTTRDGTDAVTGLPGDSPAMTREGATPGTAVISYHSTASDITFDTFEKFASYVQYENNAWVLTRHRALGLPMTDIREEYIRNAKALVAVGTGSGDRAIGMPFEVLALRTQAEAAETGVMEIALLWEGAPLAGQGFNLFRKGADANPVPFRTDADGRARLPVDTPGRYMVNAVRLLPLENEDFHWRSYWASLTFAIGAD